MLGRVLPNSKQSAKPELLYGTRSSHFRLMRQLWVTQGRLAQAQLSQEGPSWVSSIDGGCWAGPYHAPTNVPMPHHGMELSVHTFGWQGRAQVALGHCEIFLCGVQIGQEGSSQWSSGNGGHWAGFYQAQSKAQKLHYQVELASHAFGS